MLFSDFHQEYKNIKVFRDNWHNLLSFVIGWLVGWVLYLK